MMKEQLNEELQHVTFSKDRQQAVQQSIKKRQPRTKQWVAVAFVPLLLLFMGTLLFNESLKQATAQVKQSEHTVWRVLFNDWTLMILITGLVALWAYFIRRHHKPTVCPHCGHIHTKKERRKLVWSGMNKALICPHCHQRYYKNYKQNSFWSIFPGIYLIIFLPSRFFDDIWLMLVTILTSLVIYLTMLSHVQISLQKTDPLTEPVKPLW